MKRLDDNQYRALGDFRRVLREFLAFSTKGAEERGITAQQHQALLAIRVHGGQESISIGEIAETLLIKNNSAIGLVARLSEGGYAKRRESPLDRRRVLVELTPKGAAVLEEISVRNLEQLQQAATIIERLVQTASTLEDKSRRVERRHLGKPAKGAQTT